MVHIEWTSDLETSISVIDNQHRRIVKYINTLQDTLVSNDRDVVGEVLDELVDYTLTHFAFEEELMSMVEHPFLEGHVRTHQLFAEQLDGFQNRFHAGDDVAKELHDLLRSWLLKHIKHDDTEYAPAVREMITDKDMKSPLKRFFG